MWNRVRWVIPVGLIVLASGCATIRPPRGAQAVDRVLETTGYCSCGTCCGWHRNWLGMPVYSSGALAGQRKEVGVTASGTKAHRGTVAADIRYYPFGTVMYIDGYGYGRVEDRGGDIKGDHVDLFFRSHEEALEWGRRMRRAKVWFSR